MRSYIHTLDYLKTIGALHLVRSQKSLHVQYFVKGHAKEYTLKMPPHIPTPFNLGIGMVTSNILALFEKVAAARFGLAIMFLRADRYAKDLTCAQLFARYKQPETLIQKLWEPLVLGTMNTRIDKASAQVFVNIVRTIFFREHRFSRLLFPTGGLGELLVDPAVKYLTKKGHSFIYGAQISRIFEQDGKVYIDRGSSRPESYDALVYSATSYENHVLPKELLPTLPPIEFSPIINAYLWLDKEILTHPINGFVDTTIQWAFPKPSHYAKQLLSCTVSAGQNLADLPNEEIVRVFWEDICSVVPNAKDAIILRSQVIKEKRATVLLTPELQHARPKTRTAIPNLFLAGDLVQNALPMTIEGAVRNGQFAAKLARRYLFPDFEDE
jgi:hydroxysqualene dehydroxylase